MALPRGPGWHRLLPPADRPRYAGEFRSELWELAQAGPAAGPRWAIGDEPVCGRLWLLLIPLTAGLAAVMVSGRRPARCSAEPVETVQEQVQRELEFELIITALADDGRFVVVYRLGHFGDVRVSAFHLAD